MHEAVAVDSVGRRLYLTEDKPDGCFYRFTPPTWGDLSSGALEVARVLSNDSVSWSAIGDPDGDPTPTRYQVGNATSFNGGEGCVYARGHVFFTTKGDSKVHDYDPVNETIDLLYDDDLDPLATLTDADNVTSSRSDDLVVAEDVGNLELVLLSSLCEASPLVRVTGQSGTELTGPAFDPLGRRLYFSSQRGGRRRKGITYEITGPFRRVG